MHQYEAQGREKADGYSPRDFEDMTDEKSAQARAMMLTRALKGDDIDLSGLRYIGDVSTATILAAADDAAKRFGWRFDIIRHEVIYELTGDRQYLLGLSSYLDGRNAPAQERAADTFTKYPLPSTVEAFLTDRIVDGRHEAAILPLLQAWIGVRQQIVCDMLCFQHHLELIRSIKRASPKGRRGLLASAAASLTS